MQRTDGNVKHWLPARILAEIGATEDGIRAARWATPVADMDRARALISKWMGLRILAGERTIIRGRRDAGYA